MATKKKSKRGGKPRLSPRQVAAALRAVVEGGKTITSQAKRFGVTPAAIAYHVGLVEKH